MERRFGPVQGNVQNAQGGEQQRQQQHQAIVPISLKQFPDNFKQLFAFAGKICHCHRRRLTCANLLEHEKVDFHKWLGDMIEVKQKRIGKKKKLKMAAVRRSNHRFV